MPAFNDIQEAIEAELKSLEARAASLRAALGHLATAISPSFGEAVKGVIDTTKVPKKNAAAKTKRRTVKSAVAESPVERATKVVAGKISRKTAKNSVKAAEKKVIKAKKIVAKTATMRPTKAGAKTLAKPVAAKKSVNGTGDKNGLPATGADFWVAQLTAEPAVAKEVLKSAKASLGGKLTEQQVKMLSGRMGVYLSKLSQKGAIKSTKTDTGMAYSKA